MLPFSNAFSTMHSANEDEAKQEPESCIRSHSSPGVKLSKVPSDDTTKYLLLTFRGCQPVTSGTAVTPYLITQTKKDKARERSSHK